MAVTLQFQDVPLNSSEFVENELQADLTPIRDAIRQIPLVGGAALNAFNAAVGANPFTPKVRIRYKATGSCDDFAGIEIEKGEARMLFPDRYNLMAFGVGGTVQYVVDVDELFYGEEACQRGEDEEGRRKVRKFAIAMYAEINITPGFGGSVLIEEFTQLVRATECCPAAEDEGGGWLG